ncbi:MAG: hypothetical protein M1829_004493 [Trizodia sp. TS-e1964]|nr:MAG: hypothetical protein M1829_004493 [Trizodia sp. TS-e1964]
MILPTALFLLPRQNNPPPPPPPPPPDAPNQAPNTQFIIVAAVVIGTVIGSVLGYTVLRRIRISNVNPRFLPTKFLKKKWIGWEISKRYAPAGMHGPSLADLSLSPSRPTPAQTTAGGVDRNTSVRSILTLPAYNPTPRATETILGREGERGGIDTVVEFPETAEEQETRRDQEMEALYQVRVARRAENAEREERRRLRREARERGDWAALEEIRLQSRLRAAEHASPSPSGESTTSLPGSTLTTETLTPGKERERRVSSVSYAAVGLARHDGTRVRGASFDSEQPLLESAASMGRNPRQHYRDRSASSALSISTSASDTLTPQETEESRQAVDVHAQLLPSQPPDYDGIAWEDAPPYESLRDARAPVLPALHILPAIEVEGATPASSAPVSPAGEGRRRS